MLRQFSLAAGIRLSHARPRPGSRRPPGPPPSTAVPARPARRGRRRRDRPSAGSCGAGSSPPDSGPSRAECPIRPEPDSAGFPHCAPVPAPGRRQTAERSPRRRSRSEARAVGSPRQAVPHGAASAVPQGPRRRPPHAPARRTSAALPPSVRSSPAHAPQRRASRDPSAPPGRGCRARCGCSPASSRRHQSHPPDGSR